MTQPELDDRPDWYYEGFNSLREAENAWQCQAESNAEEQSGRD